MSLLGSKEDEPLEAALPRGLGSAAAPAAGNHEEVKLRLPVEDFSKRELPLS